VLGGHALTVPAGTRAFAPRAARSGVLVVVGGHGRRLLDDVGLVRLALEVGARGAGRVLVDLVLGVLDARARVLDLLDEAHDLVVRLGESGVSPCVVPGHGAHRVSSPDGRRATVVAATPILRRGERSRQPGPRAGAPSTRAASPRARGAPRAPGLLRGGRRPGGRAACPTTARRRCSATPAGRRA